MDKKIDVATFVAQKRASIKAAVTDLETKHHIVPTFHVILLGDNAASLSYIKGKTKAARAAGMQAEVLHLPASTSEAELLAEVDKLNQDTGVHGFIVQLPLPAHIDEEKIFSAIDPKKDIDGLHPDNLGRMLLGKPRLLPCTPQGIMALLEYLDVDLQGKRVVIVGRSNIVGKPSAILALEQNATVTVCHSRTVDLPEVTKEADVLIVAIGKANFINATYVKPGAVVIDVGVNKNEETGKLVGDVDYEAVKDAVGSITPVPGGVGPLTITMLLANTLKAVQLQHNIANE